MMLSLSALYSYILRKNNTPVPNIARTMFKKYITASSEPINLKSWAVFREDENIKESARITVTVSPTIPDAILLNAKYFPLVSFLSLDMSKILHHCPISTAIDAIEAFLRIDSKVLWNSFK